MKQSSTENSTTSIFSWSLLTGLFAGCAVSTKYPGLVTVSIPLCLAVIIAPFFLNSLKGKITTPTLVKLTLCMSLGLLITFGPWVLKNLVETGNPVYPLMYSLFGGEDLTPELVAKWKKGHAPDHYHLDDLFIKLMDVTLKSDWQSPLVFALLPLAFVVPSTGRNLAITFALYVLWYFGVWWVCTHRLDRFWVPLLPVACLVAGMGYSLLNNYSKFLVTFFTLAAITFNLGFITTALCGNNSYLDDLTKARKLFAVQTIRKLEPLMKDVPGKVLCVGEAQVFDATYPVIYNTVFDHSIFEAWCTTGSPSSTSIDWPLRSPAEVHKTLADHQVKYILINWQEILRYRETYGYSKFVTPNRFAWLQQHNVLGQKLNLNKENESTYRQLNTFRTDTQELIKTEMPELLFEFQGETFVQMEEYYPVLPLP